MQVAISHVDLMGEPMREAGFVHCYTGDGKGKTTAALGLALRAAGAGKRVFIAHFVKGMLYHEHTALASLANAITWRLYGRNCFIDRQPEEEDIRVAREGFIECRQQISSGHYDVVILDEITIALQYGLIDLAELLDVIRTRPPWMELVVTGRGAPEALIEACDLVTDMREVRHYYRKGVLARDGIDR